MKEMYDPIVENKDDLGNFETTRHTENNNTP